MISSQKLWAERGSGLSLAGEKSTWQPLPTGWLGQESWEVRGSSRAATSLCLCTNLFNVCCPFPRGNKT